MSITPYNRFTVQDLYNIQEPYVSSTTEFGYFRGINLGTNSWSSLPPVFNTNNGIATTVDASGVRILSGGVYKIKLSVFPTSTQVGSSNISFNFGTRYLFNESTSNVVNAFGGVCPTGMFTYDPFNNFLKPGIISWTADGYSSGNNTTNNFIKNSTTDELSYNYFNAGYPTTNALYSGNCTTEMTFILDSSATIFFNVSTNSTTGVTMGDCWFTLQLIYNTPNESWQRYAANSITRLANIAFSSTGKYIFVPQGDLTRSQNYGGNYVRCEGLPNISCTAVTTDSTGQYLVALGFLNINAHYAYRSSNFGVTWSDLSGNVGFPSSGAFSRVASTSNGQYIYLTRTGTHTLQNGGIWKSSDYGSEWTKITSDASNNYGWSEIASNSDGSQLIATVIFQAAITGFPQINSGLWISRDYGVTWNEIPQGPPIPPNFPFAANGNFRSIASSGTGQYLYILRGDHIYRSTTNGNSWIDVGRQFPTAYQTNVSTDITGRYVVCGNNRPALSTDYGETWFIFPISDGAYGQYTIITSTSPFSNNGIMTAGVTIADDNNKIITYSFKTPL